MKTIISFTMICISVLYVRQVSAQENVEIENLKKTYYAWVKSLE